MNEQEVNQKFDALVQPKVINQVVKQKREPAKFPELRYIWCVALLGSFVLVVISAVITTIIEAL